MVITRPDTVYGANSARIHFPHLAATSTNVFFANATTSITENRRRTIIVMPLPTGYPIVVFPFQSQPAPFSLATALVPAVPFLTAIVTHSTATRIDVPKTQGFFDRVNELGKTVLGIGVAVHVTRVHIGRGRDGYSSAEKKCKGGDELHCWR
jgi:hypothetical protein